MEAELLLDLTSELSIADEDFNSDLLSAKIKNAIREVKTARNYPSTYTETMINDDMERYYSTIRKIALYDYNKIGAEGEASHTENKYTRVYESRRLLFSGIIPIARM